MRAIASQLTVLVVLAASLLLSGCNDSVACVFANGCVDTAQGALGASAALRPETDDWITSDPPEIEGAFPVGVVAPTSPIMVVFSESVDPGSLNSAFQLNETTLGTIVPVAVISTFAAGRVAILSAGMPGIGGITPIDLEVGSYSLGLTQTADILDVTGQSLSAAGTSLTSFSVSATQPSAPVLVGTFPLDDSTGVSDVTEVVLVFDRDMNVASVTNASVDVQIAGSDPVTDPDPEALEFLPGTPFAMLDPRVFTWREVDGLGDPLSLGAAQSIVITLSPDGDKITDTESPAVELDEQSFSFVTSPVARPHGISLLSAPADGIGPANLTPGDAEEFLLQVDLMAEQGDIVDLFVFGDDLDEMAPELFALLRTKSVDDVGPVGSLTFDATEVDLTAALDPIEARFAEGAISFGARLRRGDFISPLIVLDVDTSVAGVQDPVLDLSGPVLDGFLTIEGGTTTYVTDQRNLVLAGDAGESIAFVEVSTTAANNGVMAPVLSTNGGLFLAQAVDLGGIVDDATAFDVVLFDQALNASDSISGTFIQRGHVGPNAPTPGGTLTVEVYDAVTLDLLNNATVSTHGDDGTTTSFIGSIATDASGAASLTLAGGTDATLVTVDLDGYDLWTFHGTPSENLAIPLQRSNSTSATSGGQVLLSDAVEIVFLSDGNKVADSRRGVFGDVFVATEGFSGGATQGADAFGAFDVSAGDLGVASFLSGDWTLVPAMFNVIELLEGFELVAPLPALAEGAASVSTIDIRGAFPSPTFDEEALAVLLPGVTVDASLTTGIDLTMLDDATLAQGEVRVSVEGLVPGIAGSIPVGVGLSAPPGTPAHWAIGLAVASSVRSGGVFAGMLETPDDLYVRAELVDMDGNRAVTRELESVVASASNIMFPSSVPVLSAPTGTTAGASYAIEFDNAVSDAQGATTFYRAQLTDAAGRGWTIWTQDPADGPTSVRMVVPDLSSASGMGLASGAIDATLTAIGARGLDATNFLWSDLEREYTVLSVSQTYSFTQP